MTVRNKNAMQETTRPKTLQLMDVAQTLRDDAIEFARSRLDADRRDRSLGKLFSNAQFVDYFKHNLAVGIANVLSSYDRHVQEVSSYELFVDWEADMLNQPVDATVRLLVKVTRTSAALEMFISSLDQALTQCLLELPGPWFAGRTFVLDASLVTVADVQLGRGYAALLSSVVSPPLRLWTREA